MLNNVGLGSDEAAIVMHWGLSGAERKTDRFKPSSGVVTDPKQKKLHSIRTICFKECPRVCRENAGVNQIFFYF